MYAKTVLGHGGVQLLYAGKGQGNFSPKAAGGGLNSRLDPIRGILGGSGFIYSPRLGFTSRWINNASVPDWVNSEPLLFRSVAEADGIMFPPSSGSIAVGFNADCPFGIILWPDERLGFCHLGLECVLPKSGEPGILDTAPFEEGCIVHVTAGIGSCCYGRDDGGFDYVFERFPEAGGTAFRGSRTGQVSLDLHQLIRSVLVKHGVTSVTVDEFCTACAATPDGKRLYYSNVADDGTSDKGGRNCVAIRRIML